MDISSTPSHSATADGIPSSVAAAAHCRSSATTPYDVEQILSLRLEGMRDMQKDVIVTLFDTDTFNNIIAVFLTGETVFHEHAFELHHDGRCRRGNRF